MKGQGSLAMTDPRSLRHTLEFQRNLAPRDSSGGFGEAWETVCTVRGGLEPGVGRGSGGESAPADWTTSINQYTARIYWRSDITEQMRILFGVRTFLISEAPQTAKTDRFMEIICEEVKS